MIEAATLPAGWKSVRLSDIGDFKSGSGFPLAVQGKEAGDYPFFKVSDFSNAGNEQALTRANHYISEAVRKRIGARVFPRGTIAFAKIGAAIFLERKRVTAQESCLDNNMAGFILSDTSHSLQLILLNFHDFALGDLVSSTALPAISSADLKGIHFALPEDPDEQQAIAQALSDIDDLIASLDALIAKKRDIKQGAMQQLLTGKRRLPGFSGDWATVPLGSLCVMKSGAGITSRTITETGQFPVYGANGLRGYTTYKTHSGVFPLIGRVGALCGNIQVARGDFFASEHAIVAEPKGKTDPTWLALALGRLGLNRLSEASAQPVLTVGKLAILPVLAPTDPLEQREISGIIWAMQDELDLVGMRLSKLKEVRQGMMQQLLTGRIRLI